MTTFQSDAAFADIPYPPRFALVALLALTVVAEAGTELVSRAEMRAAARPVELSTWPTTSANWKEFPSRNRPGLLRYNEAVAAIGPAPSHNFSMYFFKWYPGRTAGLFIRNHRPDICLPATGMKCHQRGKQAAHGQRRSSFRSLL